MSTAELKIALISRITNTENEELLKAIAEVLKTFKDEHYYKLTDEQTQTVNEAREQYARGEFLTDEEADKDIEGWLKD